MNNEEKKSVKTILELILSSSKDNQYRNKHNHKFSADIKLYSLYLFLTTGRRAYEHFVSNFNNALPSCSSVRNYLSALRSIEEGMLDFDGLLTYLIGEQCPLVVAASEDQTKVTVRIRYDPKSK